MPSILFLMKYPLHRNENLKQKFNGQMEAARALGWTAYCIGWNAQGMTLLGDKEEQFLCRNALAGVRGYDHTKVFMDLMKAARIALSRVPIDIVYLRYMPTFAGALKTVRQLKSSGGKLIVEYPTWPVAQENERFWLRSMVFRHTDRVMEKINPMVDLYTLIGDDGGAQLHGRPAMNIVNGVNVEGLPRHDARPADPAIRLLALASMSGWHGYDRIIRSLAAYKGDADVRIDFAGGDGDGSLAKWKQFSQELGLLNRITFHGPLYGDALEALIAKCDLGVGSLGMFRYGLQQGMTLKTREYIARGLPFISAVADPALPQEAHFALQVPNDETPIDMGQIVTFAQSVKRNDSLADEMRAYAAQRLSWRGILAGVLERLQA